MAAELTKLSLEERHANERNHAFRVRFELAGGDVLNL
jgi:hypothetical protein